MTFYVVALTVALLGAIAPSFSAPDSPFRALRFIPMLVVYPLFVVMAVTEGLRTAGLWWIALTGTGILLLLIAQVGLPREKRASLPGAVWKTALLWPFVLPGAADLMLIRLGIVPEPADPRLPELPEPPRGSELMALPDNEMLSAVHQILSAHADDLTAEERAIVAAETFNREVHGGGFDQWFSNTDSSVSDTVEALRAVGADANATLLERAADAVPATWSETQPLEARVRALKPIKSVLRSLDDSFFALEREEDLTSLVAEFVRRHQSRCPALA